MAVPAGTGRTAVHILAFYGYSGARSGNAWAKEANERAIRQVAAGDWNDDPEHSPALEEALLLGWKDLAAEQAHKDGVAQPEPTFVTDSGSSRIDHIFANREADAAFQSLRVGQEGEFLFPGHRPVLATFNWAECFQQVRKLRKPAAIPRPEPGDKATERERAA